jgi:hypothetical protein
MTQISFLCLRQCWTERKARCSRNTRKTTLFVVKRMAADNEKNIIRQVHVRVTDWLCYYNVRFEVFTAVTMKNGVFWAVTTCGSCKNRRFGGIWSLLHQGYLVFLRSVRRLLVAACVVPISPIFCHPDEGGARFLRNVGSYKSHTA